MKEENLAYVALGAALLFLLFSLGRKKQPVIVQQGQDNYQPPEVNPPQAGDLSPVDGLQPVSYNLTTYKVPGLTISLDNLLVDLTYYGASRSCACGA